MYFSFLRFALNVSSEVPQALSEKEWVALHKWAEQQSLLGVIYGGIQKLPSDRTPPLKWALRWSMEAEHIRGMNRRIDEVASHLTKLFDGQGVRSFILKGSANTLVYPDPSLRQTGDVDIWVEGGRSKVLDLLNKMGYMNGISANTMHVHLANDLFGEEVEVHFVATDAYSPRKNDALQSFLSGETQKSYATAGGFNVPSMVYALMMQVSHIKQHLFKGGIGLRQLIDYHQLLQHSTKEERSQVANKLRDCGQDKIAGALMYVLREILALDEGRMLCAPDERRGKFLLKIVLEGGNFGWYAEDYIQPVINRWFKDRVRFFRLLPFDATEALWRELFYWRDTVKLIPRRIKQRRLALGKR